MASTSPNGNGSSGTVPTRQFLLRQLYVKDISFESPNTPEIFSSPTEPDIKLNLNSSNKSLGDDSFEVVLHINVHATSKDKSLFLIELQQAGLFHISGFKPEEAQVILGAHCPAALFPYARETISSLVARGGFPTLILQPINFDALYAQSLQNRNKA